jgi:hypothetical protein
MNDPLYELRSRKRAARRGQADPKPDPEPSVRPPLVRRQGPSSMPRSLGVRKSIDDFIREGVAELRHRPRWIRL